MDELRQQVAGDGRKAERIALWAVFVTVCAAGGAVLWVTWPWFGFPLQARLGAWLAEQRNAWHLRRELSRDPSLGARVPAVSLVLGGPVPSHAECVIVFGGAPASCCGQSALVFAETLEQHLTSESSSRADKRVVLVFQASSQAIKHLVPRHALLGVAADPNGALARRYHAFFVPRVYLVRRGRLIWVQKNPDALPTALARELLPLLGLPATPAKAQTRKVV